MDRDLPDLCSAVSKTAGTPIDVVNAVIESFLIELHRRVYEDPRPARHYIAAKFIEEVTPLAYFHLLGILDYLYSCETDDQKWSDLQRDAVPLSDYLIGADMVRRLEKREPQPNTSRTIFVGLPSDTVQVELEVQCKGDSGEGKSWYVDNMREQASGYQFGPVVDCMLDLWDDHDVDLIVRCCAEVLTENGAFKPGMAYKLNVRITSDSIWGPSSRSGFLIFQYSDGMTFDDRDEEDGSAKARLNNQ